MSKVLQASFYRVILALFFSLFASPVLAAPTQFTSPNYGVESIIFGGTGTLRNAANSIPPTITQQPTVTDITVSSANIRWTTDKASNSVLKLGKTSGNYTLQLGDLLNTTSANHLVAVNLLSKGTTYYYRVLSTDIAGNSVQSAEFTFVTDPGDITAPKLVSGPVITNASATAVIVTWETDEVANSIVEYGTAVVTENALGKADEFTTFHQVTLTSLASNQKYFLRVRSKDPSGNVNSGDTQTLTTLGVPTITDVRVSDITLDSALVQWKTTSTTTSTVRYGQTSDYNQTTQDLNSYTQEHFSRLTNLRNGTVYYLKISGQDQSGNRLTSDEYVFKTVVLPLIADFKVGAVTSDTAHLSWTSSSEIDEFVRFSIINSSDPKLNGKGYTAGNDKLSKDHAMDLENLESDTEYQVVVIGKDIFGNQALSSSLTLRTKIDTQPPAIENVKTDTTVDLGNTKTVQVLVFFGLSKSSKAILQYGEGAGDTFDKTVDTDGDYNKNKLLVLSGLTAGQSYHFRIVAHDKVGNEAKSASYLVLAPTQPVSLFDLIFKQITDNFGFLSKINK